MSVAGQKNADHRPQSQSDSERDSERIQRMLLDLILGVVNQIFRRAATLLDGAFCRVDSIFDYISDSFLHALHIGPNLSYNGADICDFIEHFSFHSATCPISTAFIIAE